MSRSQKKREVFYGPVVPTDVLLQRIGGKRPPAPVEIMTAEQAEERQKRLAETEETVYSLATRRAHGQEIEAYLYEQAPLRVDPEHFIRQMLNEKKIFVNRLEPTKQQMVGIDPLWGRRIGHPFHHFFHTKDSLWP